MNSCDLFSGIGGISLALKGILTPILYCETDKYCQEVLNDRMLKGHLDRAPIHNDVKTLHFSKKQSPDILCGGFPCQDISSSGLQKGISGGDRSKLFYEIVRLLDETEIKFVFLENVSNILKVGMDEVLHELIKRDYKIQWLVKSASSYGAPHQRSRWFCLASKDGAHPKADSELLEPLSKWDNEPEARVSFKPDCQYDESYDDNWIHRSHCLGNSVVPYVVREAFEEMWSRVGKLDDMIETFSAYTMDYEDLSYPYPENGIIVGGKYMCMPLNAKRKKEKEGVPKIEINGRSFKSYPTPRRGMTHASMITERSLHDLPTVLINSDDAKEYIRTKLGSEYELPSKLMSIVVPNINYVEWMMGYPKDWTRVEYSEKVRSKSKKYNGMHMFMKDTPGHDVKTIAEMWNKLPSDTRKEYSIQAKIE